VLSGAATHINFILFDLTRLGLRHDIHVTEELLLNNNHSFTQITLLFAVKIVISITVDISPGGMLVCDGIIHLVVMYYGVFAFSP
jgi:hypothetical protein